MIAVWGLVLAGSAYRLFRLASRVESSEQHPPPGVRLLFPSIIRSGPNLKYVVLYYRFSGACNLVLALLTFWTPWQAVS